MKALLKPIVWVCLFFFAYQSTYAQALKIMSYNCRMSGQMTGYSVKEYAVFIRKYNPDVVMLQEIDYNTKRNKNQDFTTQLAAEGIPLTGSGKGVPASFHFLTSLKKADLLSPPNIFCTCSRLISIVPILSITYPQCIQRVRYIHQ